MFLKLLGVLLLLSSTTFIEAATDWPMLGFTQVITGADHPTFLTSARDATNRFFVVQQNGKIMLVSGSGFAPAPFLDISDRVLYSGERGLLGLAFPPDFANKKHFYVNYTRKPDGATVISRFGLTADANVADATSEEILLQIEQPASNHNGGQIEFGPEGYLYIGMGDGGNQNDPDNRGQKSDDLLGKMLRIDVESGVAATADPPYTVPADNPFVKRRNTRPEIWARGLRNPWRFSFDRLTGDLYVADVGQNTWEEVDFQRAGSRGGQNYGWRLREANHDFNIPKGFPVAALAHLTRPITEYKHPYGNSVTGGYVYRGSAFPRMQGIYFFGDFATGRVWGLVREGRLWKRIELAHTNFGISTFGENEAGELFLADYPNGKIYHLVDTGLAQTPTATPAGGTFARRNIILRTLSPNALIHYTLNGVDPLESDPAVPNGGRVLLNNSAILKAKAFRADLLPSAVLTEDYTIR